MEEISVEKKKDKKKKIWIFGTPGSRCFWEFFIFKRIFNSFMEEYTK
jgi:signal recognition particle receptor subunit beta